jgi:hypothetical protein
LAPAPVVEGINKAYEYQARTQSRDGFAVGRNDQQSTFKIPSLRAAVCYQGRLSDRGAPADSVYDLRFKLFVDPLGNTQAGKREVLQQRIVALEQTLDRLQSY